MKSLNLLFLTNALLCSMLAAVMLVGPQILYKDQSEFVFNIVRSLGFSYFSLSVLSIVAIFFSKSSPAQMLAVITFAIFHTGQALAYYIGFANSYSPIIFVILHSIFASLFIIAIASNITSIVMNIRKIDPMSKLKTQSATPGTGS